MIDIKEMIRKETTRPYTSKQKLELLELLAEDKKRFMKSYAWCPDCGDALTCSDNHQGKDGWHYYCSGCDKEFKLVPK